MRGQGSLAGTGTMIRLILRRDRIRLPIWVLGIVGIVGVSANAVQGVYATPHDREIYADTIGNSAGSVAMGGPPVALRTMGGVTVFETSSTAILAIALMGIFLTIRHTRTEEEGGRTELLRAARLGRLAPLVATFGYVSAASVVVGLGISLWFLAVGLPTGGGWVFGASVAVVGVVFAGIALVAAQVTEHARAALGGASAVLGVAFGLRAIGDVAQPAVSWTSPLGWSQAVRAYGGNRWWPLAFSVVLAAALVATSVRLVEHRDLGAGLVPPRLGAATASPRLASATGLALRLQRAAAVSWALGLLVGGVAFGSVSGDVNGLVEDRPDLKDALAPDGGNIVDGYLATSLLLLALIAGGFTVASALRLRSEETSGRVEPLLATGLSRLRWARGAIAFTGVSTVIVLAAGGLGMGVTSAIATGDAALVGDGLVGGLAYVPAACVMAAVAVLLVGWLPRASMVSWVLLAGCFVVGYLGQLLTFPQWLMDVSPYAHVPDIPVDGVSVTPLLLLLVLAVVVGGMGFVGLHRRDLG
jgi:ABC-2 type transport system permease protein